jgi:hypothetical protein
VKFPRTLAGWWKLFWIAIKCCPVHKTFTHIDPWNPYDWTRYCFKCEGISMWPGGLVHALYLNGQAPAADTAKPSPEDSDGV